MPVGGFPQRATPIFRSAFQSPDDEFNGQGKRPVVFDILAPDRETSILPDTLKMVLHVNPSSLSFNYSKVIERIQTKGGYVEQHWGDAPTTISMNLVTGGFMRMFTGLSNITGGGQDQGGGRRQTIAYDKYLDMLALFKNNGSVYDTTGEIVFQGILKMTFDGGVYLGWFSSFNVDENAEKPYMFDLSAEFTVAKEVLRLRSQAAAPPQFRPSAPPQPAVEPPAPTDAEIRAAGGTIFSAQNTQPGLLRERTPEALTRGATAFRLIDQRTPEQKGITDPRLLQKSISLPPRSLFNLEGDDG